MTYSEMQKAEAALLIAVNNPSHTDDGECDCLDCHYARSDAEHAGRERKPATRRGATKAQLEAQRLIFYMRKEYCRAMCPGRWDGDEWIPSIHEATCIEASHWLAAASG